MARFTITIEGEPWEFREALQQLLTSTAVPDGIGTPPASSSPWTRDELARLWRDIRPDARDILAELARHPGGYDFAALQERVQVDGAGIAGRLSSLGHALRSYPNRPHPVERDYRTRQYRMAPDVAEMVREIAET